MAKGRRGSGHLKSTDQDPQAAHHRGEDGSLRNGCCEGLGNKERSLLRTRVVGGGMESACVGEGRGFGARAAGAEFPDAGSADAPNLVETPHSCSSPTPTCVGEGLGKEARVARVGARASTEDARSADTRSADARSADVEFADATSRGARGGRLASHQHAGPSPRCTWGWWEKMLEETQALILEGVEDPEALNVSWSVELSRSAVRHVVGRRGRTLQRIEDHCGVFVALQDRGEEQSEVLLWGSLEGVALAAIVVTALRGACTLS